MSTTSLSTAVLGSGDIVAGRYRIEGLLGQGGMGSVYRALQLSVGRSVALKLLAPEHPATREHVERFEREAQALARLQHPSTVRLFDFGSVEPGRPFIVMELLGGADLQEELAHNGPMRWDQALRVCRQVLGSLVEAHELGIIHRDIKPANVFLCDGPSWPVVKLLDFGIAGCVELASTRKLTATGTVLGSAPYMSPEQAQGQPVGAAADLYALGVVLFEMLTGQTPFAGRGFTAQLVAKVLEPAPALLDECPGLVLPAAVCDLVGELLERDASRRPASAQALSQRLDALLAGIDLPPLERVLPQRPSQPLARTEPMLVPRTIAEGWVPPSVPSVARAVPSRRRRSLVLSALAAPALVVAWWARELREPVVLDEGGPQALVTLAAPAAFEPKGPEGEPAGAAAADDAPVNARAAAADGSPDSERAVALPEGVSVPEGASVPAGALAPEPAEPAPAAEPAVAAEPAAALEPPAATKPAAAPEPPAATKPASTTPRARRPRRASRPGVPRAPRARAARAAPRAPAPSSSLPPVAVGTAAPTGGAVTGGASPSPAAPSRPEASLPASAPAPSVASPTPEVPPLTSVPAPQAPSAPSPPVSLPASPPAQVDTSPSWSRPLPERGARPLPRYPSVAAARQAETLGEITPEERNRIVGRLREARQRERGSAIREFRDGYIGRGELRARLRDIDRRYDGFSAEYPGIHVWP